MLGNSFRLRSTLSASLRANATDIRNANRIFSSLGYITPSTRQSSKRSGEALFDGIRRFQSDHNLTTDGVMKPGGETERAISTLLEKKRNSAGRSASSLVATPETDQKPSLLDPFLSRTPGIIPEPNKHGASNEMRRAGKPGRDIRGLLELIANKAKDNAVIAEGARTVKAALKTSDHTELAKFHTQAVNDMSDDALAEIAEFGSQLKRANPEAFNSWLNIFRSELPGDAERLELASSIGENELKGSGEDGSFNTEERTGLTEETVGTPPKKYASAFWGSMKDEIDNGARC